MKMKLGMNDYSYDYSEIKKVKKDPIKFKLIVQFEHGDADLHLDSTVISEDEEDFKESIEFYMFFMDRRPTLVQIKDFYESRDLTLKGTDEEYESFANSVLQRDTFYDGDFAVIVGIKAFIDGVERIINRI